jgi:hypothetical protein
LQHVVEGEHATGLQDTVGFPVQRRLVGDVHRNVLRPSDVERTVWEGKVESIRLLVCDIIIKADPFCQFTGGAAVFLL